MRQHRRRVVLIESDWNLKLDTSVATATEMDVLIESDWNLKFYTSIFNDHLILRINRIRLEFKEVLLHALG